MGQGTGPTSQHAHCCKEHKVEKGMYIKRERRCESNNASMYIESVPPRKRTFELCSLLRGNRIGSVRGYFRTCFTWRHWLICKVGLLEGPCNLLLRFSLNLRGFQNVVDQHICSVVLSFYSPIVSVFLRCSKMFNTIFTLLHSYKQCHSSFVEKLSETEKLK